MQLPYKTFSLCPECLTKIVATVETRGNEVWITKTCRKHGAFEDKYWGDLATFQRFAKWAHDGKGITNPAINKDVIDCPRDCGLCKAHSSHTALANIVVTNRCDLKCFYCFFFASAMGYVYEPSLDQIRAMLRNLRAERPVPPNAIQFTGGNPEMRDDIIDIIRMTREEGFDHIQLNINGTRKLFNDLEWTKAIRDAGVNTIYLSFDGTTPKTNPKNHWEVPGCLDNCRKAGMGVVLVPTVIKGVNDNDVGNILRFGLKHIDVVRGINYQPVSLVGRISKADVKKYRITIPEVIDRIAQQTGLVTKEDFYPIPTVTALTHFIEEMTGQPKYELTSHFACGAATYIFKDGDKVIPIPRFVDVEGLMEYLNDKAQELKAGKSKTLTLLKVVMQIGRFIDKSKQPSGLNLISILKSVISKHNYRALGELHHRSLFIGAMHFMDLWNYDIERVKRCCIHYAQPDGRIVPFCAFNVIPQWYRDDIQKKFSMPIKDWEKKAGKKLDSELYKRDIAKLSETQLYKDTYAGFV
ncbi:MAG: radical SAM protein [Candidatus Aenigmatarchaeota archaeon]|nr:radical SAM protein [Candidatus Aenigmarchaeota archaeon]